MRHFVRFQRIRRGAAAVEYAVLVGLILLAAITAIMLVGQRTAANYTHSSQSIDNAIHAGR